MFRKSLSSGENMSYAIGELETCFTKLSNAGMQLTELIQFSILLASIEECPDYESTKAAIRTIAKDRKTLDVVSTRVIDEYREKHQAPATYKDDVMADLSKRKTLVCHFCYKEEYKANGCFCIPDSKNYKDNQRYKRDNSAKSVRNNPVLAHKRAPQ